MWIYVNFYMLICNTYKNLSLQGGEGHKPGYGGSGKFYEHKSAHKGHKGSYHEGQGTLSKIFKLVKYNWIYYKYEKLSPGKREASPLQNLTYLKLPHFLKASEGARYSWVKQKVISWPSKYRIGNKGRNTLPFTTRKEGKSTKPHKELHQDLLLRNSQLIWNSEGD